jgi:hypothetical protein
VHPPPQRPGVKKNAWEALSNLYEPTSSVFEPHWSYNLTLIVK